jgi:hypothetical protein
MSALPPIADIRQCRWDVRFVPTADIWREAHKGVSAGKWSPGLAELTFVHWSIATSHGLDDRGAADEVTPALAIRNLRAPTVKAWFLTRWHNLADSRP